MIEKRLIGISVFCLMMLVLMPTGSGRVYCFNESLLIDETVMGRSIDGSSTGYVFTENVTCPHGCENDLGKYGADCVDPPYIVTAEIIIIFIIIVLFVAFIAKKGGR